MDWQLLTVVFLVALALLYLGRGALRTWRGKGGGCGGCKCSSAPAHTSKAPSLIPVDQLRLRRR